MPRYIRSGIMSSVCFLLLGFSGPAGSQTPASSSAGGSPQGISGPDTNTVPSRTEVSTSMPPKRDIELLEFQLAEKVERKVLSGLKVLGVVLGVGIAIATFFGASIVLDYISRRVEKQVETRLADDLENYRRRLRQNLVDLEISVTEQTKMSERARVQLRELETRHEELEAVAKKSQDLHDEVENIAQRVQDAIRLTAAAQQNTEQLRDAVAESAAGRPAIFGTGFDWEGGGGRSGKNFGHTRGTLFVNLGLFMGQDKCTQVSSDPLLVTPESITTWTDTSISFQMSNEFRKRFEQEQSALQKRSPKGTSWSYEYVVEPA